MATKDPWYARLWKDRPPIQGKLAAACWVVAGAIWTALAIGSSGSMLRLMYVVLAVWAFFAAATIVAAVRTRGGRDRPSA